MSIQQIKSGVVADDAIVANKIASGAATQAKIGSGVAGTGPAFSAAKVSGADQTVSPSTWTKINYPLEEWDTANCYDTSLSRFTPNVAGYYQVSSGVWNISETLALRLYKNGTAWKQLGSMRATTSAVNFTQGAGIVFCNGTTDYLEMYGNTNATVFFVAAEYMFFQAALIRAA